MQRGRIVEDGTHAELLARGGYYARLQHYQRVDTTGAHSGTDHASVRS
jgi:ABC-type transport system involved in cytochrome bd biosynthesis fused ATPase/permease subunit